MAITISLTGTSILDETTGLQVGTDPANDLDGTDVAVAALPTAFSTYLFSAAPAGKGLSSIYSTSVGAAASPANLINVASTSALSSLGLTDADGNAFDGTVWSGLFTTRLDDDDPTIGEKIYLLSDLDNQLVLGVTNEGDIVFAVYMETSAGPSGTTDAQLWTVTFEPIQHPDPAADDEPVDLFSLVSVTATSSKTYSFDDLPSGQNLFGMVGDTEDAIVVVGELPVINQATGAYTNASDTINTSKAGGPTTIGIDNQAFNSGDGAYFTYVESPDTRYLAGAPGGLNQTEADDADNIQFGQTKEVAGGFFKIVQVTGNSTASLTLTAYDLSNDSQDGKAFINSLGTVAGATAVDITRVVVYDSDGVTVLEDSDDPTATDLGVAISIDSTTGTASITGLEAGYTVQWETAAPHDQVLVHADDGAPFDIGLFGLLDALVESQSLAGRVLVEDEAPSLSAPIADGTADYSNGYSVTNPLNGVAGTDVSGVYSVEYFTPSLSLNGITLIGELSGTTVNYFANETGTGATSGYDSGIDTLYYTFELTSPSDIDSYTFTVVNAVPADPPIFDFNDLPSGQNLFGIVAQGSLAIVVIGAAPVIAPATGKYTNLSDTINTSKGGGPTTIGINNQMFDPGEGAFFTYVDDPDARYVAGITGGLTQNEADDADNILFGDQHEVGGAFLGISQVQGNDSATLSLTAYDLADSPVATGRNFVDDLGGGDPVDITRVIVYAPDGETVLEDSDDPTATDLGVDISIDANGVATVSGLGANYTVEWETDGDHDQVLVEGVGGKFDIGFFGISEPLPTPDHQLDFTVRLTDADADWVEDSFSVFIDGNLDGSIDIPSLI